MTTNIQKSEEEAIGAVLSGWSEAIGRKDARAALAFVTDDVVEFSLAPPLQFKGKDEAGLNEWFATWKGPIGDEAYDARLIAGSDVAFWHGLVRMTGTKTDGIEVDLWFRQTTGLRKVNGAWKISHVHASVPFAMDGSERALLNLKP